MRYGAHGVDASMQPCLVVEWFEGEDLARRQRLTIAVARQTALGLHALHEAGVVHRDVKPANVYLVGGEAGALQVKLFDLGIARAASEAWSRLSARGARLTGPTRSRFSGAVPDNARCRALPRRWGVAGAEKG